MKCAGSRSGHHAGLKPDHPVGAARGARGTSTYAQADTAAAFVNVLDLEGYVLAKGDNRAFVIVGPFGDVHLLAPRERRRAEDIKASVSAISERLQSIDYAKDLARSRLAAQEERLREEQYVQHDHRMMTTGTIGLIIRIAIIVTMIIIMIAVMMVRMTTGVVAALMRSARPWSRCNGRGGSNHAGRTGTADRKKILLDAAQKAESGGLFFRIRTRVAELIDSRSGLRSVLGHITEKVGLDPRERHRLEQEALARRHGRERTALDGKKRAIEKIEQREQASLARDLK